MRESIRQLEMGIRQDFCAGKLATSQDRLDPPSVAVKGPLQTVEPLLDCVGAAAVLGGLHPKTVEHWAREGRKWALQALATSL